MVHFFVQSCDVPVDFLDFFFLFRHINGFTFFQMIADMFDHVVNFGAFIVEVVGGLLNID